MDKKNPSRQVPLAKLNEADNALFINICRIIDEAKQSVAVSANSALTMMYWHIGKTIDSYVLNGHRAEYGKQIVSTLSTQLTDIYMARTSQHAICTAWCNSHSVSLNQK